MSPSHTRVPVSRKSSPGRRAKSPYSPRARERAQTRIRFLTGAAVVGAGGATVWMGVLVAAAHPGTAAPPAAATGGTPSTTPVTSPPTTSTPPSTAPGVPAPASPVTTTTLPPTTTTLAPTTTTTRPVVISGGTSHR